MTGLLCKQKPNKLCLVLCRCCSCDIESFWNLLSSQNTGHLQQPLWCWYGWLHLCSVRKKSIRSSPWSSIYKRAGVFKGMTVAWIWWKSLAPFDNDAFVVLLTLINLIQWSLNHFRANQQGNKKLWIDNKANLFLHATFSKHTASDHLVCKVYLKVFRNIFNVLPKLA